MTVELLVELVVGLAVLLRDGFVLFFDWIALVFGVGSDRSEKGIRLSRKRVLTISACLMLLVLAVIVTLFLRDPPYRGAMWLSAYVSSFFALGLLDLARRLGRTLRECIVARMMNQ